MRNPFNRSETCYVYCNACPYRVASTNAIAHSNDCVGFSNQGKAGAYLHSSPQRAGVVQSPCLYQPHRCYRTKRRGNCHHATVFTTAPATIVPIAATERLEIIQHVCKAYEKLGRLHNVGQENTLFHQHVLRSECKSDRSGNLHAVFNTEASKDNRLHFQQPLSKQAVSHRQATSAGP